MTSVYLAYPIDLVSRDEARTRQVDSVRHQLASQGFIVYDPGKAFHHGDQTLPQSVIADIHRAALARVQCLVALWPELPTIGVPMEIEQARVRGIPMVVVTRAAHRSWALAGIDSAKFSMTFTDRMAVWLREQVLNRHQMRADEKDSLFFKLASGGILPTRSYEGDAGFDLYCAEDMRVPVNGFVDVPCGVSVQLPDNTFAMITGRSSTIRKHDLLITTGIIDNGYRGPLFAATRNMGTTPFDVKRGMRLAQLIPFANLAMQLVPTPVKELSPSDRGDQGFGSSGE